jgi:hypothetical protein
MSASAELRKRRADETINRDYLAMRERVIGVVAGSRRKPIFFDAADLDAHYNTAWQGSTTSSSPARPSRPRGVSSSRWSSAAPSTTRVASTPRAAQ